MRVLRSQTWRFPAVPGSVRSLRLQLRAALSSAGHPEDDADDLVLAVCEAATNALEHAQRPAEPVFEVCVEIDGVEVTVVVRDSGGWRRPTASRHRGRGLAMMRALADTTVAPGAHGTTVTLRSRAGGREAGRPEQGGAS